MSQSNRQQSLPGMDDPADTQTDTDEIREKQPRQCENASRTLTRSGSAEESEGTSEGGSKPARSQSTDASIPSTITPDPSSLDPHAARVAPQAALEGKTIWAIDAHSLIFQVFHAIPEMTGPRGGPVNAIFGFVRDILYLLETKQPDYLFCAFDMSGPTFRHELYDQYKIDREEMPDELQPQIPVIRDVLAAMRIPILETQGFEADDVLATLAKQCDAAGGKCYIVTGDKDCRQLITPNVFVYNIRKDLAYDEKALAEDWGIRPDQVVDFQALVGDSIDNIPGVPLIGPKIAGELLRNYDKLEGVFEHADEIKGPKRRENIIAHQAQAMVSRSLARLDADVDVAIDWDAAHVGGFDHEALAQLFGELGFRGFAEKVGGLDVARAPAEWKAEYRAIDSPERLEELVAEIRTAGSLSLDTETTHIWPRWAQIVGYAIAVEQGKGYYIPVFGPEGSRCLDREQTLATLRPLLEDPEIRKTGQNLKYEQVVLRNLGVQLCGAEFDTMIASYLLDAGERNHSLSQLARRYLNHEMIPISDLIGKGRQQKRMDEVPLEKVTEYAAEDADVAARLRPILADKLEESELTELFDTLEMPLVEVLAEMEYNGIRIDRDRLAELSERHGQRLQTLEEEIYSLAGEPFNIASPKQLADVLFTQLELPVVKKTKSGPSTDAAVLEELAAVHPLPKKVLEHRQLAKLKGTYLDALPQMVHPDTDRIHASFNQVVAATGRLSCGDPNLQNIPIRTESGREIRSAFLPAVGYKLLAADYSQIELRVLAHFSRDETLCQAFADDEDIHARVAAEVYGVADDEVTPEMRRAAKAVNFGVIYGQSPFGLAKSLGIERSEAAEFIDAYFQRYPGVEDFIAKTLEACLHSGYVKTVLGRRRAIRGVRKAASRGDFVRRRNLPERTAINTVIQGSAADLIKLAMVKIHRRLRQNSFLSRMLLQIHDELVFEVPIGEVDELAMLVQEEMSGAVDLSVPLKVDIKAGDNWAECEPWS